MIALPMASAWKDYAADGLLRNGRSVHIRAIRPDVVCKGGEYRGGRIAEQDAIESQGGEFVHLRQVPGIRTTLLLRKARAGTRAAQ